jgi:hypothetical protein
MKFKRGPVTVEMSVPDVRPQVQAGAKLLDEKYPGWHKRIRIRDLHLEDGSACVLGQVFTGRLKQGWPKEGEGEQYYGGISALFGDKVRNLTEANHGFVLPVSLERWSDRVADSGAYLLVEEATGTSVMQFAWEHLTAVWIEEIKRRKERDKKAADRKRLASASR